MFIKLNIFVKPMMDILLRNTTYKIFILNCINNDFSDIYKRIHEHSLIKFIRFSSECEAHKVDYEIVLRYCKSLIQKSLSNEQNKIYHVIFCV